MKISVILCTFNRCQSLALTLDSVANSVLPDSTEWEVLVVDNRSTDRTRDVVQDFSVRYPGRFHYLLERAQGKSYALNAGIQESRGDVVAFLDDDVTVERTWLHNLTAVLSDESWAGTGGRTRAAGAFTPPRWLSLQEPYNSGAILAALFDLGDEPLELFRPPYGANMALRRSMFEEYGKFRTDLGPGPDPDVPRPNEDVEFGRRLIAAGERLRYEPSAIVYHPILEDRIKKSYFLKWWFDYGRADAREWKLGPDVCGVPRSYLIILKAGITQTLPGICQWLFALDPVRRFYCRCQVWKTAGWIAELYRRAANPGLRNRAAARRGSV